MRWLTLFLLVSSPAFAQSNCAPRDQVVKNLSEKYGEYRAAGGLTSNNMVYEVWLSEKTRTWTIVRTMANGMSCIMASGANWVTFPPEIDGIDG